MFTDKQTQAIRGNIKKANAANRQRWDSDTHCKRGHPWASNLMLRKNGGYSGCRRCRKCYNESRNKYSKTPKLSRQIIERVITALDQGQTLSRICGGMRGQTYIGGAIINSNKLKAFCQHNPKIGSRILRRAEQNRLATFKSMSEQQRVFAAPAIMRDEGHALMQAIAKVTQHLPRFVRDEVTSQMCFEAAEGRLKIADVPQRAKAFISKHNSQYGGFVPVIGGFMYSLDKKLNDDGGSMTLGDVVSEGLWS